MFRIFIGAGLLITAIFIWWLFCVNERHPFNYYYDIQHRGLIHEKQILVGSLYETNDAELWKRVEILGVSRLVIKLEWFAKKLFLEKCPDIHGDLKVDEVDLLESDMDVKALALSGYLEEIKSDVPDAIFALLELYEELNEINLKQATLDYEFATMAIDSGDIKEYCEMASADSEYSKFDRSVFSNVTKGYDNFIRDLDGYKF